MQYAIPKGVFDILPEETQESEKWCASNRWQYLEDIIRQLAIDYGFSEIRTPIFERTELFIRSVGESSDIVSKEMYTFQDKAGRSMSLRPEGTACVMRAFAEHKFHTLAAVHKLFYMGPMFRYERPQAGRYRQHHQFGAEVIGIASPEQDVEMIDMLCELYRRLGLKDLKVLVNTVGDQPTRERYRKALQDFFRPHLGQLSNDSQVRFDRNVLRILDSKDPQDLSLLERAPSILDFLSNDAKEHFAKVNLLLSKLSLNWEINARLVRGLDYYNHTVFEILSGQLGSQNTIGAGGRYDGLLASLGGPNLPTVGFATGLERILQTMIKQGVEFPHLRGPLLYFIPLGDAARDFCFTWLAQLRHIKIAADMDLTRKKLSAALELADARHVRYCIVLGDHELASQQLELKNMHTRETLKLSFDELLPWANNLVNTKRKK